MKHIFLALAFMISLLMHAKLSAQDCTSQDLLEILSELQEFGQVHNCSLEIAENSRDGLSYFSIFLEDKATCQRTNGKFCPMMSFDVSSKNLCEMKSAKKVRSRFRQSHSSGIESNPSVKYFEIQYSESSYLMSIHLGEVFLKKPSNNKKVKCTTRPNWGEE